jgi:hypothetical protein
LLVIDNYTTDYKTIGYSLNNVFCTVNTINLSPEWYQAQAMFLEKGGILQRKCSIWWAFQGSVVQGTKQALAPVAGAPTATSGMYQEPIVPGGVPTQTVNFSLASQSVDLESAFTRLWYDVQTGINDTFQVYRVADQTTFTITIPQP